MLDLNKLWELYNDVTIGKQDPVVLECFFADMLRELEMVRTKLAARAAELQTERKAVRTTRKQLLEMVRQRDALQLQMFEEAN